MKWPNVTLSDVADINPRSRDWSKLPDDMDISFVPMPAVSEATATIEHAEVRPLGEVRKGFTPFIDDDVLFAKITPSMENGKAALASNLVNGLGVGSTEFHVLRPDKKKLTPKYLYYFIRQQSFRNAAKIRMRGAVGQQRVPEEFLEAYSIPLPPLLEQRRIVEILDQADALRKKRAQADALAQRILPAIFYKMFGDPATNPMEWKRGTLGDVITETQYGTSTRANEEANGIPVLRMNNITMDGNLDFTNVKYAALDDKELERFSLNSGDILFNRTNSKELVGKTGLWRGEFDAVPASYLIRVRVDKQLALPEFIWAFMNSPFVKRVLLDKSRRAIGMANINATELRAIPAVFPDLDKQELFARNLDAIQSLRYQSQKLRSQTDILFQSLLYRAFSGDLTAGWREAHMQELLAEMQHQARV